MTLSLPPDLQRLVRDHLAAGGFHSEAEVLRAALQMLDVRLPQAATKPRAVRPSAIRPDEQQRAAAVPSGRRSPRGMLADVASHLSLDEITEARDEMWTGFPRSEA